MENDYHNPYDHRLIGAKNSSGATSGVISDSSDHANLYEAPSCLVRNPSGSLFIPSSGKATNRLLIERLSLNYERPQMMSNTIYLNIERHSL